MAVLKEAGMAKRVKDDGCMHKALLRCLLKKISFLPVLVLLYSGVMAAEPSAAQGQSSGPYDRGQEREADFRFSAPKGFIGFRFGRFFPRAESDLFYEFFDTFTLEKNDFRAWNFGFDGGVNLHERIDLVFSADTMNRSKYSEYRDYVDLDNNPIIQETNYAQVPLTVGLKFLLIPRGRQVGRYAWLPSRLVPYISAGGGIQWYRLRQRGDFIDFIPGEERPPIEFLEVESTGWAPIGYLGGGADINIFKYAYLVLDFRYSWSKPDVAPGFWGYDTLDLAGLRATAGLQWHF